MRPATDQSPLHTQDQAAPPGIVSPQRDLTCPARRAGPLPENRGRTPEWPARLVPTRCDGPRSQRGRGARFGSPHSHGARSPVKASRARPVFIPSRPPPPRLLPPNSASLTAPASSSHGSEAAAILLQPSPSETSAPAPRETKRLHLRSAGSAPLGLPPPLPSPGHKPPGEQSGPLLTKRL